MKVLITEDQYISIQSKLIYEQVLDDLVFKLSLITEDDGKTEPDMEWNFDDIEKDIDKSKEWVKTKEQALEYISVLKDKIKSLPSDLKKKILRYVLYSFLGLFSISQIQNYLEPPIQTAVKKEKEIIKKITPQIIRKSSEGLFNHLKQKEGVVGNPVLTAYNLGDGAYTIGYGHAIFPNENEGYDFLPKYNKIRSGRTKITDEQAEILLKDDIKVAEGHLNEILNDWEIEGIKIPITQSMYDAMISLIFNMGRSGFRRSDFIQMVKKGDLKGAREQILNTSSHLFKKYPGLKKRRETEYKMFV
jgi:lysozyme